MDTLFLLTDVAAVAVNPDLSGGLPSWLSPLGNLTNISAVVVVRLAGLGMVLAAALLAVGFIFNVRATRWIGGILGAVAAVILVVNSGTVLNELAGVGAPAEEAAQASSYSVSQPIH